MGHVLGIGTSEKWHSLLYNLPSFDTCIFLGKNATAAYRKIPENKHYLHIETHYGAGTAFGHWDEARYNKELMTGHDDNLETLASYTIACMKDLGYELQNNDTTQELFSEHFLEVLKVVNSL